MRYLTSVLMAIFSASGSAPIHHRPPSAFTKSAELEEIESLKRMFADAPGDARVAEAKASSEPDSNRG